MTSDHVERSRYTYLVRNVKPEPSFEAYIRIDLRILSIEIEKKLV